MENNTANRNNPSLSTPKAPLGWEGTPVDEKGKFINLNHPFVPSLADVIRWKIQKSPFKDDKKEERWEPEVYKDASWLDSKGDTIVWLGHSTFYIQLGGLKLLTDPVFFDILAVNRKSPLPLDPKLLVGLDYVLLSHDHRDHLDERSLQLLSQQNLNASYLTGLAMKELVQNFTKSQNIQEAGWYQKYDTGDNPISITYVPARHWSKRGLRDTNERLWGGFVIEGNGKRILFGGDSGYDLHYQQLAEVFGKFDYAILGIGAYEPIWFMKPNHQSPEEALKAFQDLQAERLIPMHYGTFDLSDEPLGQPLKSLKTEAEKLHLTTKIDVATIGKPIMLMGKSHNHV
jgi:L-ascorbate metabolism protein UlaG (beta-lactamase superfamily)